jgi:7,8-dihydroneopterin aldolase/epimerase/oxygenase
MNMITVEGMEFYAFHGCSQEEKIVGIRFQVDVYIKTELSNPAQTDNINDALNYQTVYDLVAKEMKQTSNLIEHVAQRIKNRIIQHFSQAEEVMVRVSKINPPLGGKVGKVSVEL